MSKSILVFAGLVLLCTVSWHAPSACAADNVVKVDADTLVKDYEENELAANEKYKGKTIAVTGKVKTVTTESVELVDGVMRVRCQIGEGDADKVKKYKKNQIVTITGTCDGKKILSVCLSKCKFE